VLPVDNVNDLFTLVLCVVMARRETESRHEDYCPHEAGAGDTDGEGGAGGASGAGGAGGKDDSADDDDDGRGGRRARQPSGAVGRAHVDELMRRITELEEGRKQDAEDALRHASAAATTLDILRQQMTTSFAALEAAQVSREARLFEKLRGIR